MAPPTLGTILEEWGNSVSVCRDDLSAMVQIKCYEKKPRINTFKK